VEEVRPVVGVFGSPKKGLPASKQTVSNWIVQAIEYSIQLNNQKLDVVLRLVLKCNQIKTFKHLACNIINIISCFLILV